ncbi:hypothetical protein EB796_000736 [Bugula neritina]|uniref:Uncharacterized protein n=1 Tax=Bugula neritina TaxID=10212 RepID=A0A7J7KS36_BUGNE|nr:hypothetical protein EB796_000736 [Bugula neritina]
MRPADLYNSTQPSFPHLQEQRLSNLHPAEELSSTQGPLYAVRVLNSYELLKKQVEESLTILSGLEARIQDILDRFTAALPLENMEWWCMLKELKACADNLRHTLFAGRSILRSNTTTQPTTTAPSPTTTTLQVTTTSSTAVY